MGRDDGRIHPKFRLNGISYSKVALKELAYNLVKEGPSFEKPIGNFLSDWLEEKPTIGVKTSGSTGKPKNILLQKHHMVNSALATGKYFDLKIGNTALLCLPADYIAGKMMLVRALVLGLELDYVEPSSSPLNSLSREYDFSAMVPLQLENSLDEIDCIKTLIVGGASISHALQEKVRKKRTAIFETYGMTETITHVAVKRIGRVTKPSGYAQHRLDRNYFNSLPNISFSTDERECLVITAPKVSKDPVITNDIVKLISASEFKWLGRYDNVINSGGVKLFPEQIEAKLVPLIPHRLFVAGIPDETLGQKLVLIVEGEVDSERLLQKLKQSRGLEWFEIPKNIHALTEFMETETGKIRRTETLKLLEI